MNNKNNFIKKFSYFLPFMLLYSLLSHGQAADRLYKNISVQYKNSKIEAALVDIEKKTGLLFSYNPDIFKNFPPLTYSASNMAAKEVLTDILDGGIGFKNRNNYIILFKKKEEERDFWIMGYISNEATKEYLANASIYEPISLASTLSNKYGYYQIRLKKDLNRIDLKVQKENFISETIKITNRKDSKINIALAQKQVKITNIQAIENKPMRTDSIRTQISENTNPNIEIVPKPATVENTEPRTKPLENIGKTIKEKSEKFMDWLMSTTQKIHFKNINDSLSRPFQVSILPLVGTNGRMSATISNDYSLNIISGVSRSINKLEVGGFLNLVREDVSGLQIAGATNVVGGNQNGVQIAGFSNIDFASTRGVLVSGAVNLSFGQSSAAQIGGFGNLNFKESSGIQIAGAVNLNLKNYRGVQISGFANMNADTLKGSQIGVLNIAKQINNGLQLGVINIAGQAKNMLPVGLFSYVAHGGYRSLELNTNELGVLDANFKTGVKAFYNIFSVQYNTRNNGLPAYSVGYGVGSSAQINKFLSLDLNLLYSQFITKTWNSEGWTNHMASANLNLALKLGRIALFGGPAFRWYSTEDSNFESKALSVKNIGLSNTNWWAPNQRLFYWPGFNIGLRLLNKSK